MLTSVLTVWMPTLLRERCVDQPTFAVSVLREVDTPGRIIVDGTRRVERERYVNRSGVQIVKAVRVGVGEHVEFLSPLRVGVLGLAVHLGRRPGM